MSPYSVVLVTNTVLTLCQSENPVREGNSMFDIQVFGFGDDDFIAARSVESAIQYYEKLIGADEVNELLTKHPPVPLSDAALDAMILDDGTARHTRSFAAELSFQLAHGAVAPFYLGGAKAQELHKRSCFYCG
jgi:hypothetical protein